MMRFRHPQLISLFILLMFMLSITVIRSVKAQAGDIDGTLEQGAQLYSENCAVCHGNDGQGRIGARLAKDWPSIQPGLRIESVIAEGIPGSPMPAWSQSNGGPLSDAEINAIVEFILSWQNGGYPEILTTITPALQVTPVMPPDVSGDPTLGASIYQENCVMCHGENGEGRIGASLAKDWPSIRPDLRIKNTIERGIENSNMPAWSTEYGGPLGENDINNVIAYILTWSTQPNLPPATSTPTVTVASEGLSITNQQIFVILFVVIVIIVITSVIYYLYRRS